jgi:hypothetical protein
MNVRAFLQNLKEAALRRFIERDVPLSQNDPYPAEFPPLSHFQQGYKPPVAAPTPPPAAPKPVAPPRMAPAVEAPAAPKAQLVTNLTPMQKKIADSLEQIFEFRVNTAREEGGEPTGPRLHALALKFQEDMEQKILSSPPMARQDTRVALQFVMSKLMGSNDKVDPQTALQELESKYLSMVSQARQANGGRYDVEALNNEFIAKYSKDPKYAPYMREFLEKIQSQILPEENAPTMVDENESLSEQEIRGLIFLNGATATGSMPEIRDNPTNSHIFTEIMNEAKEKRGIDREAMAVLFESSYLAFDAQDPKSFQRYYKMFINNAAKISAQDAVKIVTKGLKGSADSMTSRLESSNIPHFIENVMFNPDDYGKENFMKYFLDRDKKALMSVISQNGATPEELTEVSNIKKEITDDSGKTRKKGKNTEEVQNVCIKYIKPLSEYVMNLMRHKDEEFFDWACQEAWRWAGRTQNKERQGAQVKNDDGSMSAFDYSDTKSDGGWSEERGDIMEQQNDEEAEFGGETLDDREENAVGRDLEQGGVFESEGLPGDKNVVDMNGLVRPAKLTSFFANYRKLNGLYSDVKNAMESRYEQAKQELAQNPKNRKKIRAVMFNMLQKAVLYERIFATADKIMNGLFMKAQDGNDIHVGDERLKNILNQEWDSLFKQEDWGNFDWSMNDPQIQAVVNKGVQDGLGDAASVYADVIGKAYDDKGNVNKNNIQRKIDAGMESMQEVYLSPEIVAKHGKEAIISFIDLTGFRKNIASLGALLSKTNSATYDDKIEYLTELVRKGALPHLSEEEIENMPLRQVAEIFGGVQRQLQALYGKSEDMISIIEDPANPYVSAEDISQVAAASGMPQVNSKETFQKLPPDKKLGLAKKLYATPKFQKFKLFIDRNETGLRKMLRYYVGQETSKNPQFLSSIGAGSEDDIYAMPRRRVLQIAQKFFPQVYRAYSSGEMKNTEVYKVLSKVDSAKNELVANELLTDFLNKFQTLQQVEAPQEEAGGDDDGGSATDGRTTFYDQALAFARILDMPTAQRVAAHAHYPVMRKIANQKRTNDLLVLRYRLAKRNVDTSVVDAIIERLAENARRESMGSQ